MNRWLGFAASVLMFSSLSGCSSTTIKSADYVPIQQETAEIAEAYLLDVGIQVFDTGLDEAVEDEDLLIFPEIRKAESRFIPYQLMETMQASAAWGALRVVPNENSSADLLVQGAIVQSDGEILLLKITAKDASDKIWFTKVYEGLASRYSYDRRRGEEADPFQGIYNAIANDLLKHRRTLSNEQLASIRTISQLRFAQSFSGEAFGDHLTTDRKGIYSVARLPAENDPMLQRINQIRERDYIFIDTLQDHYGNFVREMDGPYKEWRRQTYDEVISMRKLQRTARNRTIAGIAAIVAGIAAAGSNNGATATAGQVGVIAGGYTVKSGFEKNAQSKIHVEALQELGDSLEAEIEPQVIALEDRTITLTGTVENQYEQWRELLRDIYTLDTQGSLAP